MHKMRNILPYRPVLPSLTALILGYGLTFSGLACANAEITFKGTLIEQPPCEISSSTGGAIEVDFGSEIVTRRVNGVNYKEKIPVALDCTNAVNQKLQLTFNGTTGFATGLITTSKPTELGIRLYNGMIMMTPGTPINFTPTTIPELYAVPVAKDNSTLSSGEFTGKANLIVSYQ